MIEEILIKNQSIHYNPILRPKIWSQSGFNINLTQHLKSLFFQTSHRNKTLFKVPLYEETQWNRLVPKFLDFPKKMYICACFWMLKQEFVNFNDLRQFTQGLPTSELKFDDIRFDQNYLKLQVNNKVLVFDRNKQQVSIQENKEYLNCSFPIKVEKSLKKITIQGVSYSFNEIIKKIQSSEHYLSISTPSSIYIISLNNNNGKSYQFDAIDVIDMRWQKNTLYYLCKYNQISSIHISKQYSTNNKSCLSFIQATITSKYYLQDFSCYRICFCNEYLVAVFTKKSDPGTFFFCKLNEKNIQQKPKMYKLVTPFKMYENNLYWNVISHESILTLAVINEYQGTVKYQQYKTACYI